MKNKFDTIFIVVDRLGFALCRLAAKWRVRRMLEEISDKHSSPLTRDEFREYALNATEYAQKDSDNFLVCSDDDVAYTN